MKKLLFYILLAAVWTACHPPSRTGVTTRPRPNQPNRPAPTRPTPTAPMDTVRWTNPANPKPPIKNEPGTPGTQPGAGTGSTYHVAFLLPFLTAQSDGTIVPEKSELANQFYAGAKIALDQLSREERTNFVVDVYDTQANDADFQKVMSNTKLEKAAVFIGPVRSSHVQMFAEWGKQRRKIIVSPETPTADLTKQNPGFIQINPSLRAHCEAIVRYVRRTHRPDEVTLLCKVKEADRLAYFHNANNAIGGSVFNELIVPDETANFSKVDLKRYLRPGRTAVFILPTWASQDFVNAFLRNLNSIKGSNQVEVYGMPQWAGFETIEPEFFMNNNVYITSASYIDYTQQQIKAFQQKFYDATGTIPDNDGFNGYDVTLFTGRMLSRYGLSFPERLRTEAFRGLHGDFQFVNRFAAGAVDDGRNQPDYVENTFVHLLKFGKTGFVPAN
ncbi:MAG TPA: ABC transporter substrate-binding protein [Saprospiraceae bacterium]|nr:ABC transporter substrate-binding protein [Saprospiraceae bacterium]HPI05479.1 ABC transporter substrate-binding protein [Saprospiraceae bacterium]